ncbi:hypothetical protein [Tabrizicola sp. BL-A-41-H6]|uniref:hypothetical protein n=1 Tax=Tabrizicola sp. BL-A-41-H6 TaxID=3421107 RepID=UPI003D677CA9
MTILSRLFPVFIAVGLAASPAAAYEAQNGFTVRQLDKSRFEVLPRGGLSASDAWCAAGDFVIHGLRLARNTKIWRISEPPRPSGKSIVFSLSSDGATSNTGLASFGGGASVSANHGDTICDSMRMMRLDR